MTAPLDQHDRFGINAPRTRRTHVVLKTQQKAQLIRWLDILGPRAWTLKPSELAASATDALGFIVTPSIAESHRKAAVPKEAPNIICVIPRPWWRRLIDRALAE